MVSPGTRLGPYEIGSVIGVGGMGKVYRARDTRLNRDVAVKVLPDALAHDAGRSGRLLREARVLPSGRRRGGQRIAIRYSLPEPRSPRRNRSAPESPNR
jgi:hypothetical protein